MAQLPEDDVKPGAPEWVVTFGDMMSLLLTFFVLLLSFSSMEASKFKIIAGYMREAFGVQTSENYSGVPMGTTILSTDVRTNDDPAEELQLVRAIRRELDKAGVTKQATVEVTERGVAVRLKGEVLFAAGRAELKQDSTVLLGGIAEIAAERPGVVEVEGHTDDVPISTTRYPSNWELSGARAGRAARFLIQQGVPAARVKAVGYADTRPLAPNDSSESRARNRRVEFLFVRDSQESSPASGTDLQPVQTTATPSR